MTSVACGGVVAPMELEVSPEVSDDQPSATSTLAQVPNSDSYDIGQLLEMGITVDSLSEAKKFDILIKHYSPPPDYVFPKTYMNGCNRTFSNVWLTKHPWLRYSQAKDGGYCLPCVLFCRKEGLGTLVSSPFRRWTKSSTVLGEHERLNYHLTALTQAECFRKTAMLPEKSIEGYLSKEAAALVAENRKVLASLAECVAFCGRQGLALRGHRDDATADPSTNRGNFISLVEFRAASGDVVLQEHLQKSSKNATYTSKTVQNELIDILSDQIRTRILDEVRSAKYYSILADEVTDVSRLEQVALVVRFVDARNEIREEFVDFATAERITGKELASLILNHLQKWGLDIQNCRGQGYDGASNMSAANGVQGIISRENPQAVYVHCNAHVLNLCIVKTCQIPVVKDMNGIITELAQFFWNSPKRQRLLETVLEKDAPQTKKTHLKSLCRTRWVERHQAYETFCELYTHVTKVLEAMSHGQLFAADYGDWSWDSETRNLANGFLHRITSFDFIVAFITTMKILAFVKPISIKLQKRSNDVIKAYGMVDEVLKELKDVRNSDATFSEWYAECEKLGTDVGTQPAVPRTVARQRHRCNVQYSTPEEYYRRSVFLPLADHITTEMSERFGPLQKKAAQLLRLIPSVIAAGGGGRYEEIKEECLGDLPSPAVFDVEWVRWRKKWQTSDKGLGMVSSPPDTLAGALKECDADGFPNINTVLRLACTLPVTSAETERCNSTLKGLKTKLRSTMSEGRLSSLCMLKIHYHIPLDIKAAVDTFASNNPRRMRMSVM